MGQADYRPPETEGEKRAKAAEAAALKQQGNALFAQGERFEAAKLYEQAVLKFDWFSDALADEAERALVLPVKLPCHLNLALCSVQLGNYAHAAVHCTQVLRHEPGNAKALFRRGVCHTHLGQLEEARADLLAARQRLPADAKLHDALAKLRVRRPSRTPAAAARGRTPCEQAAAARAWPSRPPLRLPLFLAFPPGPRLQLKGEEYRRRSQRMSHRMIHALSESDSEGAGAASEAREHGAARESRDGAETLARADGEGEEDGSSRDDVGAPASAPAPEGQRGRRAAVCLATAAAARGAVRESPVVLGPMALPAHRVASAYACADCDRDGAEHDTPALLHPVLGLICPTCRLVLCASSER